jgi:hypothetical protein
MSPHLFADDLRDLARNTLGKADAGGINAMLEFIARRFNAFGCVLWEVPTEAEHTSDPAKRRLITLASWCQTGVLFAMDDVPLDDSPTARVALRQCSAICADIRAHGGATKDHPFWQRHRIKSLCAAPVLFLSGCKGAIEIYRREGDQPFVREDEARLDRIGQVVPGIHRAATDRLERKLLVSVERILREADHAATQQPRRRRSLAQVHHALQLVCTEIAKAFHCAETSIFLEDLEASPGTTFRRVASTGQRYFECKTYRLPEDAGRFTGWVLAQGEPIHVQDLAKLERDAEILRDLYPGLALGDGDTYREEARQIFNLAPTDDLPPLSLMAVPILGPYEPPHFSADDEEGESSEGGSAADKAYGAHEPHGSNGATEEEPQGEDEAGAEEALPPEETEDDAPFEEFTTAGNFAGATPWQQRFLDPGDSESEHPPEGDTAAPDVRGVIRCYLATAGPYYFSWHEVDLLRRAAEQVGQWWARWRARTELEQENKTWSLLVAKLAELNAAVRAELARPPQPAQAGALASPAVTAILQLALRQLPEILPGTELSSIRLLDPARGELLHAAFSEEAEAELQRVGPDKAAPLPIRGRSQCTSLKAFLSGKTLPVPRTDPAARPLFPTTGWMLTAPIPAAPSAGTATDPTSRKARRNPTSPGPTREASLATPAGLLDIRWTKKPTTSCAQEIATLLAQQLGLYLQLLQRTPTSV